MHFCVCFVVVIVLVRSFVLFHVFLFVRVEEKKCVARRIYGDIFAFVNVSKESQKC